MPSLLVIDDSSTIRKLVELSFRGTEWTVEYAASGGEGVRQAKTAPPDVILLDFVLPDQRGVDVATSLARDPKTAAVPIMLMTAKEEGVRELFAGLPSVRQYVKKPFQAAELQTRVRNLAGSEPPAPPPAHADRREAIAKALFARLRRPLTMIPSWCAQMGASPPAAFFARKLLTSEVIGEIVETVLAHVAEETPKVASDASLSGTTNGWPIADVITLLGASGRSGELALTRGSTRTLVYVRGGEIVFVTSTDPVEWARGLDLDLHAVPASVRATAEADQRANGKPLAITLAEHHALPASVELANVLHEAGRKAVLDLLDDKSMTFRFRETDTLPSYVEAYGRPVSLRRRTLIYSAPTSNETPASLAGLALERARDASRGDPPLPPVELVVDRVRGFSDKVRGVRFDARERRVLALIDGRWTLHGIARRAGLSENEVRRVAWSLLEVGLITPAESNGARPVLVIDRDVEGFQRPLETMLARRPEPVRVVRMDDTDDVVEAALREKPSVVILDAGGPWNAEETARAFRKKQELENVALVAVLEVPAAAHAPALEAAGFDAVLVKPVAFADLERLIRL